MTALRGCPCDDEATTLLPHSSHSPHALSYILTSLPYTLFFHYAPPAPCTICTHAHDRAGQRSSFQSNGQSRGGGECLRGELLAGGCERPANPHRGSRFSRRRGVDMRRNFQLAWRVISGQ
ncbi:hypothetical protein E2C01_016535 [Portunus trituberculatus]|uniref:Uncharacterized protein n=1 Tax=Portunus trituberculatus TaxID=210409 RepID=A0A5B7DQI0_PORTR|nr:hypothetical protein [Portunus trituberculatus]